MGRACLLVEGSGQCWLEVVLEEVRNVLGKVSVDVRERWLEVLR